MHNISPVSLHSLGGYKDKVSEAEWKYLHVNEHWQQLKNMMMERALATCGLSEGPCRHNETWWWNEEVAEAVRGTKKKYGNWKKIDRGIEEYKRSKQIARMVISLAKGKKQKECASDLNDPNHHDEFF